MAVPYHTHPFTIPTATPEQVISRASGVAITPDALPVTLPGYGVNLAVEAFTPTGAANTTVGDLLNKASRSVQSIPSFISAATAKIANGTTHVYVEYYAPNVMVPSSYSGGGKYRLVSSEPSHGIKFFNGGWWELNEDIVNVRMAGAKGDGIADDHAAFEAAFKYGALYGKQIILDQGLYLHSKTIKVLPTKNIRGWPLQTLAQPGPITFGQPDTLSIRGEGNPILRATAVMDYQIAFTTDYAFPQSVEPQSIRLERFILQGGYLAKKGIQHAWGNRNTHVEMQYFEHEENIELFHSAVNNFQFCVFDATKQFIDFTVDGAGDSQIWGCDGYVRDTGYRIHSGSNTKFYGGLLTGHVFPAGVVMKGIHITTAGQAAFFQARNITINGLEGVGLDHLVYAYDDDSSGSQGIWGLNIVNCHTIRNSYKPNIKLAYLRNCTAPLITGNTCAGPYDNAENADPDVHLFDCNGATVTDNRFYQSKDRAVLLEFSDGCRVANNFFSACGRTSSPVYVMGNNNQVVHNTFVGATLFATAIEEATGGYASNVFKDNVFAAGQTRPIIRFSATTSLREETAFAIPTTGYWGVSDRVYFWDAPGQGYIGAVCTVAGTPGTWKKFGQIAP